MLTTLFFSFKAAYVRQDIHEVIAAGMLMLLALWHVSRKPDIRTMELVLISLVLCCGLRPTSVLSSWRKRGRGMPWKVIALASDLHLFEKRFHRVKGKGSLDSLLVPLVPPDSGDRERCSMESKDGNAELFRLYSSADGGQRRPLVTIDAT